MVYANVRYANVWLECFFYEIFILLQVLKLSDSAIPKLNHPIWFKC